MDKRDQKKLASHVRNWRNDLNAYGKANVKIIDKAGNETPFALNRAQQYMEERIENQKRRKGYVRVILLKGRQQGASKYNCLRGLRNTTLYTNVNAFVMAHDANTTSSLFEDYKSLYNSIPDFPVIKPEPKKSNARELEFAEIGSKIKVGTAGSAEVGRGTTIHKFHGSECAFWQNGDKLLAGVMQAVPLEKDTEVILESTANGVGNKFYQMCMKAMRGEGEFELVFIPWWWTAEYKLDNQDFEPEEDDWNYYDTWMKRDVPDEEEGIAKLAWRRAKIHELGEKKFRQEYPANPVEAFQMSGENLFKPEWVKCAQDTKLDVDKSLPLVIGVDAAEAGGDRTVLCFRRGNRVPRIDVYDEMDEMRLAGIVGELIRKYNPTKVFFDKAYANGCVGRLRELGFGHICEAIPFGSGAIEKDRFLNKRAEMYWMGKEWLEQGFMDFDPETGQGGVDIPVNDAFAADLAAIPEPPATSNGKIKMVDKQKIKEEFGKSIDIADAFFLTFAKPVAHNTQRATIKVKHKSAARQVLGD